MKTATATPPRYDDLPDLLTPDDARAFLQVGRATIYELIKTGDVPSVRYGKHIRIPKTALLKNGTGHEHG